MTDYQAAPENWAFCERTGYDGPAYDCILELRARVEALEAARRPAAKVYDINEPLQLTPEQAQHVRDLLAPNSKPTPNPSQIRSSLVERVEPIHLGEPVPISLLVERVRHAIASEHDPIEWCWDEARAAIRAVAAWLSQESEGYLASGAQWAGRLQREAER